MSSKYYYLWNALKLLKLNYSYLSVVPLRKFPKRSIVGSCTIGFSLFTWLGFEKKLSAEDELIQTIKHCVLFTQRSEYDKAEQLLHVALRQAQQLHHQLGITYIYDVMANLALEREQLDKAKQLFIAVTQRIMSDGAKEDDSRVVHVSLKLARISHLKKEYNTAQLGYEWCLQKLNHTFKEEPSEGIKKLLAMAEDWYGRLFIDCNRCEEGLQLLISAMNRMNEIADVEKEHIIIQLNDIGTIYDRLGKTDESINYFKKAIELGKDIPGMEQLGAMYVNLGQAYIKKNLLDEARKHCGHGWKLGYQAKNNDIKQEAELCINKIKSMS